MKIVILMLVANIAAPQPAQQFDLVCSGTISTLRVTLAAQTPDETYSRHYRIDLKSGTWCEGMCEAIRPIAEVQPGFLRLQEQNKERSILGHPGSFRSEIDRTNGEEHMTDEDRDNLLGKSLTTWDGKCSSAAFSGFPKIETKF